MNNNFLQIDARGPMYCRNVYQDIDGCIKPLPFDAKCDGLWHFDGQVFWLPERST